MISLRSVVKFPADVVGTAGIVVDKSGATYTFSVDTDFVAPSQDPTFRGTVSFDSGTVFNWGNGDAILTHSPNFLSLVGATLAVPNLVTDSFFIGISSPFTDVAGVTTLTNIDALDATTEATIEAAIDTLANLTSIQGHTVTLGGNFVYETGSWTPTDVSGGGLTFASTSAGYTKIGNMIFAYASVTWPATAEGSAATIGGLPFNTANAGYARQCSLTTSTETTLAGLIPIANGSTISLRTTTSGTITNATMSGDTVFFIAIYPIA